MGRRRKRTQPPQPERLRMAIEDVMRECHLFERRLENGARMVEDETNMDIEGEITHIVRGHGKHLDHRFSLGLMVARHFEESGERREQGFMLPVRLRGEDRGAAAYILADTFWRISTMLEQGLVSVIELSFEPLRYGSGSLEGITFAGRDEEWTE